MLAGELYFYNEDAEIIEKMDMYDYDDMSKDQFTQYLAERDCFKVTLHGYYTNHQVNPKVEVICIKRRTWTVFSELLGHFS